LIEGKKNEEKKRGGGGLRRVGCTVICFFARITAVFVDLAPHGAVVNIEDVLRSHHDLAC
jgi:hypothetical protein